MVRRAGASPGDRVYVSGTIGDAALGLLVARNDERVGRLEDSHRAYLLARYRLPEPRTVLAPSVLCHASAALDVSDGLVGDLDKICAVSGVSAHIPADSVPLSHAAAAAIRRDPSLLGLCLTGGDDYEILAAIPAGNAAGFEKAAGDAGVPVHGIGEITAGVGPAVVLDSRGKPMAFAKRAFSHVGGTYSGS
jgi:thiamine-monophosphate kinase